MFSSCTVIFHPGDGEAKTGAHSSLVSHFLFPPAACLQLAPGQQGDAEQRAGRHSAGFGASVPLEVALSPCAECLGQHGRRAWSNQGTPIVRSNHSTLMRAFLLCCEFELLISYIGQHAQ